MLAIQSELFLGGWNRSGVNRWPDGRAIPGNGAHPTRIKTPREPHLVSWISHFRPCGFLTVRTPDLHRGMRNDGPG